MKTLFRISIATLAAAILATGCGKDQIIDPVPAPEKNEMIGYLTLGNLNLSVSHDAETIQSGKTRAAQTEADGAYRIEIIDRNDSQIAWSGTYAQIQDLDEPLPLGSVPGQYTIKAHSPGEVSDVAWEAPQYSGQTDFTIVTRDTTTVNDLICTMSNIKTSVELAADLKDLFKDDAQNPLTTTIAINDAECIFSRNEDRNAFFKAPAQTTSMKVTLSGLYNVKGEGETPDYQPLTMTQTIDNVKAGQWRKVAIAVEHTSDGNVQFIVKVETWVYDDQIDVDVMSTYAFGEETIPDGNEGVSDPDAPILTLDGQLDITQPFTISEQDFDMDLHTCLKRLSLIATPTSQATIAEAYCVFDSDNTELLAALATAGYADGKIILYPENQTSEYAVVRTDAENRMLIKVNDKGMFGLYNFEGTHTAMIVVTDNQDRHSYTPITIQVTKGAIEGSGPEIAWRSGDFSIRHQIKPQMDVVIDITSKTGITKFIVEISGDLLTADELKDLGLATYMDLVNPADDKMREALENFGFLPKSGESIYGKTNMSFDISGLVPMLGFLGRKGPCDFKLTVTDASGTHAETLMFEVL